MMMVVVGPDQGLVANEVLLHGILYAYYTQCGGNGLRYTTSLFGLYHTKPSLFG